MTELGYSYLAQWERKEHIFKQSDMDCLTAPLKYIYLLVVQIVLTLGLEEAEMYLPLCHSLVKSKIHFHCIFFKWIRRSWPHKCYSENQ